MNILLPTAGTGSRFLREGYTLPKPLIPVLGKPMISHVIRNLYLTQEDRVYVIHTEELEQYSFQSILRKELPYTNLHFLALKYPTRGPVETVLCGLNRIPDLHQPILVLDCDAFYEEDILSRVRTEINDFLFYFEDSSLDPIYSYIDIIDGQVVAIAEKQKISNHACTGAYGFQSGALLACYCEGVLDRNDRSSGEYYLSSVYARFLEHGRIVVPYAVQNFHCLGTPNQLQNFHKEAGYTKMDSRPFNHVHREGDTVIKLKGGDRTTSGSGEAYWYQHIPESMREHFPKVLNLSNNRIQMEHVQGTLFSHLLVNNSLTQRNLRSLLETVQQLHSLPLSPDTSIDYCLNYSPKINQRAQEFDYCQVSMEADDVRGLLTSRLDQHVPLIGVIHGDLVFSNVFLCDRQLIKFIDMRGRVGDTDTIFGDVFYDWAKVYQSLWGYDFILNNCEPNLSYLERLRFQFEEWFLERFSMEQLDMLHHLTAGLLFSLIPLHSDQSKQKKYFALLQELL